MLLDFSTNLFLTLFVTSLTEKNYWTDNSYYSDLEVIIYTVNSSTIRNI